MKNKELIFKIILILTIVLILANLFDAITTYFALQKEGLHEGRAVMKFLLEKLGFWAYIIKISASYFFLPFRYCPMHYPINNAFKSKHPSTRIFTITLVIGLYLFLIWYFLRIGLENLMFII